MSIPRRNTPAKSTRTRYVQGSIYSKVGQPKKIVVSAHKILEAKANRLMREKEFYQSLQNQCGPSAHAILDDAMNMDREVGQPPANTNQASYGGGLHNTGINGDDQEDDEESFWEDDDGDVVFDISHEGGENTHIVRMYEGQLRAALGHSYLPRENRTRQGRLWNCDETWKTQLASLADAYLSWKHGSKVPPIPLESIGIPAPSEGITVSVVSIQALEQDRHFSISHGDMFPNVTLVKSGFLASSPTYPTVAISLEVLELYRLLKNRCPQVGIEPFVRVICDLHAHPSREHLRKQFSTAFDIYLRILAEVDQRVAVALGRDGPGSYQKSVCPPCFYELHDEPEMKYRLLAALDGNNSIKRVAAAGKQDPRICDTSDIFLSEASVDVFQCDVNQHRTKNISVPLSSLEADENVLGESILRPCTINWKADAPDSSKKMWSIFRETGNFVAVCRHMKVLVVCDMIRSGELSKYPLAIINKLLDLYGPRIGLGYDIGCSLSTTIENSSLGPRFAASHSRLAVPAFHGYGHGRACQLKDHVGMVEGFGNEDLEGCERVFSYTNQVARCARYASAYTRKSAIMGALKHWNREMQKSTGDLLYSKYVRALDIISSNSPLVQSFMVTRRLSRGDMAKYIDDERQYLEALKAEPKHDTDSVVYVELLQKLEVSRVAHQAFCASFVNSTPDNFSSQQSQTASGTRRLENARSSAFQRLCDYEAEVTRLECALGVSQRWTSQTPEYIRTLAYMKIRTYQLTLDKVEALLVSRIFEMEKMNLSGTGYKLRTQISKALRTRSAAIKTAIVRYNEAAAALDPPRPALEWKSVIEYSFLSQFDLLRDCRQDVTKAEWSFPATRAAVQAFFKVERALEEVQRLNVEVRRLRTWIVDEEQDLTETSKVILASDPLLSLEIARRRDHQVRINHINVLQIKKIEALMGFSGTASFGVRKGRSDVRDNTDNFGSSHGSHGMEDEESDEVGRGPEDDDELAEKLTAVNDFLESML